MKFVDPKNDFAFKKIFGDETKSQILISLLNAILDFKDNKTIVSLEILNPFQVPKIEDLKNTILDIRAKNQDNEEFIVEMQKKDLNNFEKRSLYYTSKAYVSQLDKKEDYSLLNKVYFIGILNFNMFEDDDYISRHLILNKKTLKQDLEDFEFTFIELKKFNKELNQLDTILDKWIYFINNADDLTMMPKEYETLEEFKEAFTVANQLNWNKQEIEVYDYVKRTEIDDINALKKAEDKGIVKGIEQGIEQEKLNLAKNLLDILDDETISLKTGLDITTVANLRKIEKVLIV
jgi:predicted transposase/invertase (TIGR01784 family)